MDVKPMNLGDRQVIQGYGRGGFRVSGRAYEGSILVLPDRVVPLARDDVGALALESLEQVVAQKPPVDVLLVGCGERTALPPPPVRRGLREAGVSTEPMPTDAACRTFNMLVAEDRRVAAALIAV